MHTNCQVLKNGKMIRITICPCGFPDCVVALGDNTATDYISKCVFCNCFTCNALHPLSSRKGIFRNIGIEGLPGPLSPVPCNCRQLFAQGIPQIAVSNPHT